MKSILIGAVSSSKKMSFTSDLSWLVGKDNMDVAKFGYTEFHPAPLSRISGRAANV